MRKIIGRFLLGMVMMAGLSSGASIHAQAPITNWFTLRNYVTGYCLAVAGGNPQPGTPLITWACDGTYSQYWYQGDPTADGSLAGYPAYTLVSALMPCRDCHVMAGVQGGIDQDLQPVILWTEDPTDYGDPEGVDNQGWALEYYTNDWNGHACYQVLNAGIQRQSAYNLGVSSGSTAEGAQIVVWQDQDSVANHPDQLWCIY